jgi:hypothetical protein
VRPRSLHPHTRLRDHLDGYGRSRPAFRLRLAQPSRRLPNAGLKEQKTAESEVESFRKDLGPLVVATETTRMAMRVHGRKGTQPTAHFSNDSVLSLAGYDREQVHGQSFDFLIGRDQGEEGRRCHQHRLRLMDGDLRRPNLNLERHDRVPFRCLKRSGKPTAASLSGASA